MNSIERDRAADFLPEVIARKVQSIARENDVETFELMLDRSIAPYWEQTYLLPRNPRAWFYTGGTCWIFYSDGDLFAQPLITAPQSEFFSSPMPGEVWVITLDDGSKHLRVSQCALSPTKGDESLE